MLIFVNKIIDMYSHSIDKEFLGYYNQLNTPQKVSLLSFIKSFVSKEGRVSIEDYNFELEAAEKRIMDGDFIEHSDVEKESEQW